MDIIYLSIILDGLKLFNFFIMLKLHTNECDRPQCNFPISIIITKLLDILYTLI